MLVTMAPMRFPTRILGLGSFQPKAQLGSTHARASPLSREVRREDREMWLHRFQGLKIRQNQPQGWRKQRKQAANYLGFSIQSWVSGFLILGDTEISLTRSISYMHPSPPIITHNWRQTKEASSCLFPVIFRWLEMRHLFRQT